MKSLKDFLISIDKPKLSAADRARAILWWVGRNDNTIGMTISKICSEIELLGHPGQNQSRLNEQLGKDKKRISRVPGKKAWRLHPKGRAELDLLYKDLLNPTNINLKEIRKVGTLMVVNKKATFSFDVFLREIIGKAKNKVLIADSYVDETLIDNYLGGISDNIIIKILYGNDFGAFQIRAKRHKTQFSKFAFLQYKDMHDRFVIIDDIGYVLGPSIKDAAINSPALVVALNSEESKLLDSFFMELWNLSK